jgi:hypothetical protein
LIGDRPPLQSEKDARGTPFRQADYYE